MKNYKIFTITIILIVFATIAIVNYVDMPAPSKLEKKILDVQMKLSINLIYLHFVTILKV